MKEQYDSVFRQEKVRELLKNELISDQRMLVELLKKNYGIDTNQTVISRDLRKLGVVKKMIKGVMAYEIPAVDIRIEILKLALVDIVHNDAIIVIKTHPGLADFVGDYLDSHSDLEIIGCIAGENVVFVAPSSVKEMKRIYQSICQKLQFKKK